MSEEAFMPRPSLDDEGAVPLMQWGNPERVHTRGDIAALRFGDQDAQYRHGARWLRSLLGAPWQDRRGVSERGLAPSDMAVLCRVRSQMPAVVAALRAVGLEPLVRGEASLLVPPEAEMMATVSDYLAGRRANLPSRGGMGGSTFTPVGEVDVRSAVLTADLGLSEVAADAGVAYLARMRVSAVWTRTNKCLIEVLEEFLASMGYHAAWDGEGSSLYPSRAPTSSSTSALVRPSGELRWHNIARVLIAAADAQRFNFALPLNHKVAMFAAWLRLEAPLAYRGDEQGADDGLRATPNAVHVVSCHSVKGLEYPAIWVPDLADGRFPLFRPRDGAKIWNLLPFGALTPAQARRADGEDEDDHRLWYVSATRASRWLLATYAPPDGWRNPRPSVYLTELERHPAAVTDPRDIPAASRRDSRRLPPSPRPETSTITVTFSQLFLFWVCPRQFYLRYIVGFPPPLAPALNYGKSLHDAASEVHRRVQGGEELTDDKLEGIALRHFSAPYSSGDLTDSLRTAAVRALQAYYSGYCVGGDGRVAYIEREVRVDLGGITLVGRIDVAVERESGEVALAELKTEDAPSSDDELLAYGLGFEAGTGRLPDTVETRPLRADGDTASREVRVDSVAVAATRERIRTAGADIARGHFPMAPQAGGITCARCDVRNLCLRGQSEVAVSGDKDIPRGETG